MKVCGMKYPENIARISGLKIDWIGFIFYPGSPRYVERSDKEAMALQSFLSSSRLPFPSPASPPPRRVGVFVNDTVERMIETAQLYGLDYLQLHGNESPDMCHSLQKRGYSLIKVFSIACKEDLKATETYEGRVDYFLFDTACKGYGGSGRTFDWSLLDAYKGNTPFLLSGGINPGHAEAVGRFSHPCWAGIDLNSGFEMSPGVKDVEQLRQFIGQIQHKGTEDTDK